MSLFLYVFIVFLGVSLFVIGFLCFSGRAAASTISEYQLSENSQNNAFRLSQKTHVLPIGIPPPLGAPPWEGGIHGTFAEWLACAGVRDLDQEGASTYGGDAENYGLPTLRTAGVSLKLDFEHPRPLRPGLAPRAGIVFVVVFVFIFILLGF